MQPIAAESPVDTFCNPSFSDLTDMVIYFPQGTEKKIKTIIIIYDFMTFLILNLLGYTPYLKFHSSLFRIGALGASGIFSNSI